MQSRQFLPPYLLLGLAIFSMFFGAGNVIYPMDLGVHAGATPSAWFGFILTAIGAPLLGLYAVLLSKGDLFKLFDQTGIKGATIWIMILILALGPIGATPRCVLLAYQALKAIMPNLSLPLFTSILGLALLYVCLKRTQAFAILGKWLSPILLILLLWIAGLSITSAQTASATDGHLLQGLQQGYQTMDLLASLLFAVTLIHFIKHMGLKDDEAKTTYLKAALIGAGLLCFVYLCLGLAASKYAVQLSNLSKDLYLNAISLQTLGSIGSQIACSIIFLACVTTIVALMIACTENAILVAHRINPKWHIAYGPLMAIALLLTMIVANLGFDKVSEYISLIVTITYPVYIMIALCQILHVRFKIKRINSLVYATFMIALVYYAYEHHFFLIT